MRNRRAFIIRVHIAAGLIFGAPILIGLMIESGRRINAPTVKPRLETILNDVRFRGVDQYDRAGFSAASFGGTRIQAERESTKLALSSRLHIPIIK
jgi:hypothetical protein